MLHSVLNIGVSSINALINYTCCHGPGIFLSAVLWSPCAIILKSPVPNAFERFLNRLRYAYPLSNSTWPRIDFEASEAEICS